MSHAIVQTDETINSDNWSHVTRGDGLNEMVQYDVDANDFQYPRNLQDEHLKQYWLQEKEDLRCMGLGGAGVEQEIELLDSFLRWSLCHSSWGY